MKAYQQKATNQLRRHLNESWEQIVDHYVPIVTRNPPDEIRYRIPSSPISECGEVEAKAWLHKELSWIFPKVETLVEHMRLTVRYKDVTFETLCDSDFQDALREKLRHIDWEIVYGDFLAAGRNVSDLDLGL